VTAISTADQLLQYTHDIPERPIPEALLAARREMMAAVRELATLTDADLVKPWPWIGGPDAEQVRYGFYRISEAFERAGIEADRALRASGIDRALAADLIAPATAARWDLQGLLLPLPDQLWDADPGGGEWTIRQTMGHVVGGQRGYGVVTAWWQGQGLPASRSDLPWTPEEVYQQLPSDEEEGEGSPTEIRDRLDEQLDHATERLAGLPADRLALGARWAGFPVDIGFRLGRWSSHLREHAIQVEKTLVMLGHTPAEVDRLIRLVLAAWGRAEAVVYGATDADEAIAILASAVGEASATAAAVVRTAQSA
jgi:DinB superfamily